MISAVTAPGLLRFTTYRGLCTAAPVLDFCRKLLHDTDGPVYLVVDGPPKAKTVKEFVAATDGRLTLVLLPASSPHLNPGEGVWTNVEHDRVGRTSATTADEFKANVLAAAETPAHGPGVLRRPRPRLHHRMTTVD